MYNNICVSVCPPGLYMFNRTCQPCSPPCQTCTNSADICQSCVAGYVLNVNNRTCTRNSTCNYGHYLANNGRCERICPANSYYFSGGCLFQCPQGYISNEFGGCVQVSSPSICAFPLFRQGSTCVPNCLEGYWPNQMTRTCDPCSDSCSKCFTSTFCTMCESGYILSEDQTTCIRSSRCQSFEYQYGLGCYAVCPVGTHSQGRICVRSCRVRTYFYQGYCYASCPTRFHNADACLDQCTSTYCLNVWDCKWFLLPFYLYGHSFFFNTIYFYFIFVEYSSIDFIFDRF